MKVLLIDDHALFREGVAMLLRRVEPELQAVELGSVEQALDWLAAHGPADLALVDLKLPGMGGMDGVGPLRAAAAGMPVVVMSSDDDRATMLAAIDRGAVGFIPKSSTSDEMFAALRLVMARGIYLPRSLVQLPGTPGAPQDGTLFGRAALPTSPRALGLTPRQIDVLRLLLLGKPAKLIARELDVAESTVKTHTSAVLRALNVTTRTQAVVAASRMGLRFS